MTSTRSSPSGKLVQLPPPSPGNVPTYSAQRLNSNVPLTVLPVDLFVGFQPLLGEPSPRIALITVCLLIVNTVGFDGAPIAGAVGLQRNADVPINMGNYRSIPVGPGEPGVGVPMLWISTTLTQVAPDDTFRLFASSISDGGAVGDAATVTSLPLSDDAGSVLSFLFP
jgi:hypothetical protein